MAMSEYTVVPKDVDLNKSGYTGVTNKGRVVHVTKEDMEQGILTLASGKKIGVEREKLLDTWEASFHKQMAEMCGVPSGFLTTHDADAADYSIGWFGYDTGNKYDVLGLCNLWGIHTIDEGKQPAQPEGEKVMGPGTLLGGAVCGATERPTANALDKLERQRRITKETKIKLSKSLGLLPNGAEDPTIEMSEVQFHPAGLVNTLGVNGPVFSMSIALSHKEVGAQRTCDVDTHTGSAVFRACEMLKEEIIKTAIEITERDLHDAECAAAMEAQAVLKNISGPLHRHDF